MERSAEGFGKVGVGVGGWDCELEKKIVEYYCIGWFLGSGLRHHFGECVACHLV